MFKIIFQYLVEYIHIFCCCVYVMLPENKLNNSIKNIKNRNFDFKIIFQFKNVLNKRYVYFNFVYNCLKQFEQNDYFVLVYLTIL